MENSIKSELVRLLATATITARTKNNTVDITMNAIVAEAVIPTSPSTNSITR